MILSDFLILTAIFTTLGHSLPSYNQTQALLTQLALIQYQLQSTNPTLISHFLEPKYRFTQITHTSISLDSQQESAQHISMHSSFNIYNNDKTSYPILLRYGNQFYSVTGKKIVSFNTHSQVLVSSSRGQFTYFAQITNLSVYIKKLGYIHGKPDLQPQSQIDLNEFEGEITSFSVAFSLSKKLFALGTSRGKIRFYKSEGLVTEVDLGMGVGEISLLRLNNHLIAYSKAQIYLIQSSNPKAQNIQKCLVPSLDSFGISALKYDPGNFKHFYLMANSRIYLYQYQLHCKPIAIYPLAFSQNQAHHLQDFIPTSNMLILTYIQHPSLYLYYNLTDKSYHKLILPITYCHHESDTYIQVSQKSSTDYMLCDFCSQNKSTQKEAQSSKIKFSCYSLQIGASTQKSDGTQFSKLRIPLIIASLFIIVYFGITKSKKKKEEGPYEKMLTRDREVEDSQYRKLLVAKNLQKKQR